MLMRGGGENEEGLKDLVNYLPKGLEMIEVGTYAGEGAEIFAQSMSKVICIDSWESWYKESEPHFDKVAEKYDNIVKIKDRVENIKLDPVDFVYIDAEHDYDNVKRDIEHYLPMAKKYIGGHDYKDKFPGVIKAVNEKFGKPDKVFADSSWLCIL